MARIIGLIFCVTAMIICSILLNMPKDEESNAMTEMPVLEAFKLTENTKESYQYSIQDLIHLRFEEYFKILPDAINTGRFSDISIFLNPEGSIYYTQKNKTAYLFQESIKCNLISYEILSINEDENPGKYYAEILEKYDWKFGDDYSYFDEHIGMYTLEIYADDETPINDENNNSKYYSTIPEIMILEAGEKEYAELDLENKSPIPTILPKKQKDDKYAMVEKALKAVSEYVEVDYEKRTESKIFGCGYLPGEGMNQLFSLYEQRNKKLVETRLKRKIIMSQILSSEQKNNDGYVNIALQTETVVDGNYSYDDKNLQIRLKRVSPEVWFVYQIYGLPFP